VAAVPGTNRYLGAQYRPTNNSNKKAKLTGLDGQRKYEELLDLQNVPSLAKNQQKARNKKQKNMKLSSSL
jgi:hypothetical protein